MDVLDRIVEIEVESPVDKIVKQIRKLIASGQLQPGDKLPAERRLSEKFGIGRTHVRDAIKKLEFFGVLKTNPQSGTVVAGVDLTAIEGLFSNVMKLGENDFYHLVETRVLMEAFVCRQAAIRRTDEDLIALKRALLDYQATDKDPSELLNEDFSFHLRIAEAAKNTVVRSLLLIIIPDILAIYRKFNVCGKGVNKKSVDEHELILKCIIEQDADGAEQAMREHLKEVFEFSKTFNEKQISEA